MSSNTRLNLILLAVLVLLIGGNVAGFTYRLWGPAVNQYVADYWKAHTLKPAIKAGDRTIAECLGVSDFYSAHLTTYFLADSDESAGGPTDDLTKYAEYCDRVPGTGRVIFSVTLMEKDARNEPIAISFHQTDSAGGLEEINALPPKRYPSGMLSVETTVAHKGKYVLRLAFGEARNKEDVIDMPILVGR
ncbi:MAG: hypothetical protein C3F11_13100 [Methylocystaceae bacterium]|nr:MAG: hypothetical protein C3F11_13100 [Methylocystaceae bacterium]